MFHQRIDNGYQVEEPDPWLREGFPWEIERFEFAQTIKFGGYTSTYRDLTGKTRYRWEGTQDVLAIPLRRSGTRVSQRNRQHAAPVVGRGNRRVRPRGVQRGQLRGCRRVEERGREHHDGAVSERATESGQELRLKQQYFLASASLQDSLRYWN